MACTNFKYDDKNVAISSMHKLSKNDDENVIISGMHRLQTAPTTGLTQIHHILIQLTWTVFPSTGRMKRIRCQSICAPAMTNQQPRLVLGYAWPHANPEVDERMANDNRRS